MHAIALATFPETKNAPGKAGGTVVLLLAGYRGQISNLFVKDLGKICDFAGRFKT
jgi:hypothetical protein